MHKWVPIKAITKIKFKTFVLIVYVSTIMTMCFPNHAVDFDNKTSQNFASKSFKNESLLVKNSDLFSTSVNLSHQLTTILVQVLQKTYFRNEKNCLWNE